MRRWLLRGKRSWALALGSVALVYFAQQAENPKWLVAAVASIAFQIGWVWGWLDADQEVTRLKEIETAATELCLAESGPVGRMLDEIERLGIESLDQLPPDTVMGFLTDKDDPLSAAFVKLRATLGIPEEDDEPEEN